MNDRAYWIQGPAQSGKTTRLMAQFRDCMNQAGDFAPNQGPNLLIFAATGDNRIALVDRLTEATGGQYPIQSTTPLAFFESEVSLFWPLLLQKLDLKPRFPLRLRPETEQELATRLWQPELTQGPLKQEGVSEWRLVRRVLDLYLLSASSGTPVENVGAVLQAGMAKALGSAELWAAMGEALVRWRRWCLERGLLTYGLLTELYGQNLLPDLLYRTQLQGRFDGILVDDLDEYPAIVYPLFRQFLPGSASTQTTSQTASQAPPLALFTYNPSGAVRLGFGADPQMLAQLALDCTVETLLPSPDRLAYTYGDTIVQMVRDAGGEGSSAEVGGRQTAAQEVGFRQISTVARSQLLRAVAEEIITGVQSGLVQPQEIAVVGPGVDAIARYTLMEILGKQNIRLEPLTEQRPLYSAPMVRALLTLLAFVYPGLGHLLDPDQVAEMLVVLSLATSGTAGASTETVQSQTTQSQTAQPRIDPVRAGLLADYCYVPDPDHPKLLPMQSFPRWDRLGYAASTAYGQLLHWLETQRLQQEQRLTPSPLVVLDRAIQTFLWNGSALAYDQLAALRELLEAAQHYWDVEARLTPEEVRMPAAQADDPSNPLPKQAVERFILLLRGGTVTANPYPVQPLDRQSRSVALATLFQYRINRPVHRWQFWLDAGSPLWLTSSGTNLFGAHLFTHNALADLEAAQTEGSSRALEIAEARLENGLRDLLSHATERVYVCASELATNGQPQLGPLLSIQLSPQVSIQQASVS
ncbi:MAG: recombinase family protein [Synechococcales cyanobacterium RU_4_20]|nr:recombinase family protein [Synechococcales cyanobacterium RU_4_20]NJR68787.1 recombinase family protein [Synechococcales cyanobacterium CRU_2_2]